MEQVQGVHASVSAANGERRGRDLARFGESVEYQRLDDSDPCSSNSDQAKHGFDRKLRLVSTGNDV